MGVVTAYIFAAVGRSAAFHKVTTTIDHRGVGSIRDGVPAPVPDTNPDANLISSADLRWSFGGKSQRGWLIYAPLVSHMRRTSDAVGTNGFARAVGRWQEARALRKTGVIDSETWFSIIGALQSARVKDRSHPSDNDLIEAPPSEIYDPERPAALRRVEKGAYAAYKRLLTGAMKDRSLGLRVTRAGALDPSEKYLKIVSAFRTRDYQDQLRKASPHLGSAGLAVNSPHFTGRALDLYVGGEPVNTSDSNRLLQTRTSVYRWLVKNAGKFGFHPYFYEPWHWEHVR